jgi:hypothetical protein
VVRLIMMWVRCFFVVTGIWLASGAVMAQAQIDTLRSDSKTISFDKGKRDRFREIYNQYLKEKKIPVKCSYLMLNNLSRAGATLETAEAFDCINSYLALLDQHPGTNLEYLILLEQEDASKYVTLSENPSDRTPKQISDISFSSYLKALAE